jgi:hypothetical protein
MKVIPGDALAYNVHGAAARPHGAGKQAQFRPQGADAPHQGAGSVQARPAAAAGAARATAPAHYVERPIAEAPQRAQPRGSLLDISV